MKNPPAAAAPESAALQLQKQQGLQSAIEALEMQRAVLGDDVVDRALAPLRERLISSAPQAGLELRLVTVLFADIVGSTQITQQLDAEDTLHVLGGALERMAAIVRAHQGRVMRFTGDGIKAVFGADQAREDDAERALRAGLQMLQASQDHAEEVLQRFAIDHFALRVGVHTGPVASGAGFEDKDTVVGATVHIAARMEQSAPPGTLRISHETWNHVRGLFEVVEQPAELMQGIAQPMSSYLVKGLCASSAAAPERGIPGLRVALVGRAAELAQLHEVVTQADQMAQVQVLSVISAAGLGKSRLLQELAQALPTRRLLRARAQPDGALRPWGLLRQLITERFEIADSDGAAVARDKLVQGMQRAFSGKQNQASRAAVGAGDQASIEADAHVLGQLVGFEFDQSPHVQGHDPRTLRDLAFAACARALRALRDIDGQSPVMLIEDLHWADAGSLELLRHLASLGDQAPCALLMNARPSLLRQQPDWPEVGPMLRLAPLPSELGQALCQSLLQRLPAVPPALADRLVAQAEGNPYYMEEMVRRLIDQGVVEAPEKGDWTLHDEKLIGLQLPGTLVGMLQARLDTLQPPVRRAAQLASIVGHVFWDSALAALDTQAPLALPTLQKQAIVQASTSSAIESATEWHFDHHLLHEVVYDTLTKARRRRGHAAVANWLSQRAAERGAEFLALTGDHAERAGNAAQAIDCFQRAARQASQRFANAAAGSYLRRAIDLVDETQPDLHFQLLNQLEDLCDAIGDRALQQTVLAEIGQQLARHPDDARQARWLYARALYHDRLSQYAPARELALQALPLALASENTKVGAEVQGLLCWLSLVNTDFTQARACAKAGLALARQARAPLPSTEAKLLVLLAMVSMHEGHLREARTMLREALEHAQSIGEARLVLGCYDNLCVIALKLAELDEARPWAKAMHAQALRAGNMPRVAHALMHLAELAQCSGDSASAVQHWRQVNEITISTGDHRVQSAALHRIGRSLLKSGDCSAALASFEQAQKLNLDQGETTNAAANAAHAALCLLQMDRPERAKSRVDWALERLGAATFDQLAGSLWQALWSCVQVLAGLGDERSEATLRALHAEMQTEARTASATSDETVADAEEVRTRAAIEAAYAKLDRAKTLS